MGYSTERNFGVAAIDVGSNAFRFIISEVNSTGKLFTLKELRVPIRLGSDVFSTGSISTKNFRKAVEAFKKFSKFIKFYGVKDVRAVATSAVREAKNGGDFVAELMSETGIKLEIINFEREALLIQSAVSNCLSTKNKQMVVMDIGGGSIEYIYSSSGDIKSIESFPYGTVRSLSRVKKSATGKLNEVLEEARTHIRNYSHKVGVDIDTLVGTGGNFVCLGELRVDLFERRSPLKMRYNELIDIISILESLGYQGRIKELKMKPQRADVIIPAAYLVKITMEEFHQEIVQIPQVGLRDGLLLRNKF